MDYIYGNIDPGNIDYTGVSSKTADIIVDNEARTIQCNVHDDVGFDIRETLPKDSSGKYVEGDYKLTVSIVNNIPSFVWTKLANGSVFYGVTDAANLTADVVSGLTNAGSLKKSYECVFEPRKQMSVFAYPESFGPLSSIKHKETGFEVLSGWSISTIEIEDITYTVYSTSKSTGTYTYTFTY